MELLNPTLFGVGVLVFASVLAGLYSARAGLSFLLVFLVAGMLAGEDGPGGIVYDDFRVAFWVGNAALAVILLDGGLRTRLATFRTGLKPALALATVGVVITAGLTGAAAALLLGVDLRLGALLGAIVGSTDAAAVFAMLKGSGVRLSERMSATLEIESGLNDPMAVFLTIALIGLVLAPQDATFWSLAGLLAQQMLVGAFGGVALGMAMSQWLRRAPVDADHEGLAALLLVAAGIATFAGIGWLGGSGFLAVYLFGLVVAHRAGAAVRTALSAMDGYAWLAQAGMFLLLGLLVTPSRLLPNMLPALAIAAVLMLLARPLAVWLCLKPLRFRNGEIAFVSWVGLRGAVPIVLAVFPVMAGVPDARLFFDVAFVVVLASLLMQGASIGWAARRCGVALPPQADEPAHRKAFGDFVLDPRMPMAALCEFYTLPAPGEGAGSLGDWMQRHLGRPAVEGDHCDWGTAHFAVRTMDGPRIVSIGLQIRGDDGELGTPSPSGAGVAAAPLRGEA